MASLAVPSYRDRIAAFYAKYCPDKPMSHVDYLLSKYTGNEEDIIAVLVEKYGPEPVIPAYTVEQRVESLLATGGRSDAAARETASGLVRDYKGAEDVLIKTLTDTAGSEPRTRLDRTGAMGGGGDAGAIRSATAARPARERPASDAEFEAALAVRRQVFEQDMKQAAEAKGQQQALEVMQAVSEAKIALQRQEIELQELRLAYSALQMQAAANEQALTDSIHHVAQQLTQTKLRHLALASTQNTRVVSASELQQIFRETADVERDMQTSIAYCQTLAQVVRRHLQLYPLTPVHGALRQADPALCARLDQS